MPAPRRSVHISAGKGEEAVRISLGLAGCREARSAEKCGVLWLGGSDEELQAALAAGRPGVLVNRLVGMKELTHKVAFAKVFATAQRLNPSAFSFVPRTFVLPEEVEALQRFLSARRQRHVIYKPDGGSQGDGIFVCASWADMRAKASVLERPAVAQEYMARPLTLHGLKFDLRVYVLVASVAPLRAFVCREGLARFATAPYRDSALRDLTAHLTNYSLNVKGQAYEQQDDPEDGSRGSKRTLSSTLRELAAASGLELHAFWCELQLLAARTCVAMQPHLAQAAAQAGAAAGFHLLGLDVLLDSSLKMHLLEVNASPSLGLDVCEPLPPEGTSGKPCLCMEMGCAHVHRPCQVDHVAKRAAVGGALRIVLECRAAGDAEEATASEADGGGDASPSLYIDLAEEVATAEAEVGEIAMAQALFQRCAARGAALSSTRARALLQRAGLSSAEADIAILKAKRSGGRNELGFQEFVAMLLGLCERPAGGRSAARQGRDAEGRDAEAGSLRGALRSLLERMAAA